MKITVQKQNCAKRHERQIRNKIDFPFASQKMHKFCCSYFCFYVPMPIQIQFCYFDLCLLFHVQRSFVLVNRSNCELINRRKEKKDRQFYNELICDI